jgi:hypothetical protein
MFSTDAKEEVERVLSSRGDVDFIWGKNDTLKIQITKSAFATHPVTGERCFRAMRLCDFNNVQYMVRELAKDQMSYLNYLSVTSAVGLASWLVSMPWVEHERHSWKTSFKDGTELSKAEKDALTKTLFDNSTIFRWHSGDALVVDNIKTAHARLNVDSHRKLHVFLSEYLEVG